jgi:hypothetical protein
MKSLQFHEYDGLYFFVLRSLVFHIQSSIYLVLGRSGETVFERMRQSVTATVPPILRFMDLCLKHIVVVKVTFEMKFDVCLNQ